MEKYLGFISYSSNDRDMVWPIHHALESLKVPKNIALPPDSPLKNRTFRPIFLDRRNLPFGSEEYKKHILTALENSQWLVVFCSPRSALSQPVREEIEYFLSVHPKGWERVIPVILDGNPWSQDDAALQCLPQPLREHWPHIRDWPMPSTKGIIIVPHKYEMALSKMAQQTLNDNWGASSVGKSWHDNIRSFFEDTLISPPKKLAQGFADQIGAYMLHVPLAQLRNALQEEKNKLFRVRMALAFAGLLAMLGLVQWAMYERHLGGTQAAYNQQNSAQQALEKGESSAALAYLASSLRSRPLPDVRQQLQRLLLQESWFIPMPPAPDTYLTKDRSFYDAFFYTRATTSFFSASMPNPDEVPQMVALLPNGDFVEWTLPGTLILHRRDKSQHHIYTAPQGKGVIPLGLMRGDAAYAFAQVPLGSEAGLEAVTRVHVLRTADWSHESSVTITGWLHGLCVSPLSEHIFVAYADTPDKKAWLAAFAPGSDAPLWRTSIPALSNNLRISPDGASLLLTLPEGLETFGNVRLALFDTHSGQQGQITPPLLPLAHVEFSPDGQRLAMVDMQNTLRLRDVHALSKEVVQPLRLHQKPAMIFFSANGRYVAFMRKDTTQWYGIQLAQPLAEHVSVRDLGAVPAVHALPGEEALLVVQNGLGGNSMDIRDYKGAQRSNALPAGSQHLASALSHDGRLLALVGEDNDGKITVYSIEKQQNPDQLYLLRLHAELVASRKVDHLAFQPGGSLLLAATRTSTTPGVVNLFDLQEPTRAPRLLRLENSLADARFSTDGKHILTHSDAAAQMWSTANLQRTAGPWDAAKQVDKIYSNPFRQGLAIATWQQLHYYDASKLLWTVPLSMRCTNMAFSPDGALLAVVYNRREIQIMDCATGTMSAPPVLTDSPVESLSFAPSGKELLLLVSTRSSTVAKWEKGELLLYSLGENLFAWKPQPLASYVLGFQYGSGGTAIPWGREGFFRIPALRLLGEEEPMAAEIAETLGSWELDAKGSLQPARQSLLQPAEQLALSSGWRTCLQWLQSPVEKKAATPGGHIPLQSVLDQKSSLNTLDDLREVLRTDPGHRGALARMGWTGSMRIGDAEIKRPYLEPQFAAGEQAGSAEIQREAAAAAALDAWRDTLLSGGVDKLYAIPRARQHMDFWTQRAASLHPQAMESVAERITFFRHTRRYAEAEALLSQALQQNPRHPELLKEQVLLAANTGKLSEQKQHLTAQITTLRQQKELKGYDLVRASMDLFELRVRQNGELDATTLARHMEDITLALSQSPVSTLATRRTEDYLFDKLYELRQWPLALAPGQQLVQNILSAARARSLPAFDSRALPNWRSLAALYALLQGDPQTTLNLLTNTSEKQSLPLPSFLLLPGLAKEMLGQDGRQSLQEAVDAVLALEKTLYALDALHTFYALQARGVVFSPAVQKARLALEHKAGTALQRGIVCVKGVIPDGAGSKAGLAAGDYIVSYDGIPMISASAFIGHHMLQKQGEPREATVQRNGSLLSVHLPAGMLGIELADEL